MRKCLYLILLFCTISLTGCGAKDVVYDIEKSAEDNTAGEETETKETKPKADSGDTLAAALGITDNHWKETIGSGTDAIFINADVEVPNVSAMYTLEVSEHYYTSEEQRKIAEYFLDADTIRVNKDKVITREWLQKRLDYCNDTIEFLENEAERCENNGQPMEAAQVSAQKKMLSNEKKRFTDLMNAAPAVSDVSETVQDYSENYYIGSKDGVEYTLSFDVDEERNASSWTLEAVDRNGFSSEQVGQSVNLYGGVSSYYSDNICEMTKEEACSKAEEWCEKLGIYGMKAAAVCDLVFYSGSHKEDIVSQEDFDKFYTDNGYSIVLVRDIKGVAVDSIEYHVDTYLDTETTARAYDKEKVVVELNDKGLISMSYVGGLNVKEVGNAVKLLSFDQIQELYRKELKSMDTGEDRKMGYMYLGYTRVADESKPDEYCYIPVWCLSRYNFHRTLRYGIDESGALSVGTLEDTIFLNAIDGSRINSDKAGFAHYINPKEYFDDYLSSYFDEEDAWVVEDDDFWEEEEAAKERRENTLFKLPERETE